MLSLSAVSLSAVSCVAAIVFDDVSPNERAAVQVAAIEWRDWFYVHLIQFRSWELS